MRLTRHHMSHVVLILLLAATIVGAGCENQQQPMGFGPALDGYPVTANALDAMAKTTGWPVTLAVFFMQWPTDKAPNFPAQSVEEIQKAGGIPVITWEPMVVTNGKEHAIDADEILNGSWDGYIDAFAQAARDNKGRIILRFAHEMNLARYHWGSDKAAFGPDSPARYRAMFRYVRTRFMRQDAGNVLFAFCPNAESLPHPTRDGATWNTAGAYYPGNDAVDVLGMDGYNWGTTFTRAQHGWDSRFMSFAEIFISLREELQSLAPKKPLMVFETASVTLGGDKTAWIEDAIRTAREWKLAGLCWFEADKEQDWRISSGVDLTRLRLLTEEFTTEAAMLALPTNTDNQP